MSTLNMKALKPGTFVTVVDKTGRKLKMVVKEAAGLTHLSQYPVGLAVRADVNQPLKFFMHPDYEILVGDIPHNQWFMEDGRWCDTHGCTKITKVKSTWSTFIPGMTVLVPGMKVRIKVDGRKIAGTVDTVDHSIVRIKFDESFSTPDGRLDVAMSYTPAGDFRWAPPNGIKAVHERRIRKVKL